MLERFLDRLAGHELAAEKPHREIHGLSYDRLATPSQDAAQGSRHAMLAARRDELAGDQQAPGGRVHEPGPARADMRAPVALRELVANENVARLVVGNAQERLREAHQRHALGCRERELFHQRLDPEGMTAFGPHFGDEAVGEALNLGRQGRDRAALLRPAGGRRPVRARGRQP